MLCGGAWWSVWGRAGWYGLERGHVEPCGGTMRVVPSGAWMFDQSLSHLCEPLALEFHDDLSLEGRLAYGSCVCCVQLSPPPTVIPSSSPASALAAPGEALALGLFPPCLSDEERRHWTCFSDGGCQLSATWLLLMSVRKSMLLRLSYVRRSPLVVRARAFAAYGCGGWSG